MCKSAPCFQFIHACVRKLTLSNAPHAGHAAMKSLLLIAAVAAVIPAFSQAQDPSAPIVALTPEQQVCAQLIANTTRMGIPLSDCALDLAKKRLIVRGEGWAKLDLSALCSGPVAELNNGGHFTIELKQGNNDAGTHIDCNISNTIR